MPFFQITKNENARYLYEKNINGFCVNKNNIFFQARQGIFIQYGQKNNRIDKVRHNSLSNITKWRILGKPVPTLD